MKRTAYFRLMITMIVLFFASNVNLFAQDRETVKQKSEAHYGLKVGINFAELWGKDALPESDRKVGYSFGVYSSYKISKEWKIQPEVIWSLQGEKSKESGRYKISYLNIPIMFKWKSKKFYTELGPQLGILTVNTAKSVPDDLRIENFETFDFSLNAGLGYEVFEDWSIGVRYIQGITNIVSGRDLRNSVIYIGIAYRIF
ncbi:porin family protein [Algoriphagus sp.]|uniref:porin family protein n=1 Tax=Algoriphagus sp. TaxID=1872435 RepID=UPI00391BA51C